MKEKPKPVNKQPDQYLPEDARTHTFFVYETSTGHLVHGHRVVVLPYGEALGKEQMMQQALEFAVEISGRDPNGLRAIEVSEDELKPGLAYKVNLKSERLERLDVG